MNNMILFIHTMKKAHLIAALFAFIYFACINPLQAQVGEPRDNLSIGINGGVNINSVSFTPTIKQNNYMGFTGGFTARYISEKYFAMICGLQVELNYSQHGWEEKYEDSDQSYSRSMNYLEIPFLAHLAFGKEKGARIYIHAGPQVGFLLSESENFSSNWEKPTSGTVDQYELKADKKFDYGIAGGLGLELRTKAGNFQLEGRYYFGLADFYNNTKKDYFSRSAHTAIQVKIAYLIDLRK